MPLVQAMCYHCAAHVATFVMKDDPLCPHCEERLIRSKTTTKMRNRTRMRKDYHGRYVEIERPFIQV